MTRSHSGSNLTSAVATGRAARGQLYDNAAQLNLDVRHTAHARQQQTQTVPESSPVLHCDHFSDLPRRLLAKYMDNSRLQGTLAHMHVPG